MTPIRLPVRRLGAPLPEGVVFVLDDMAGDLTAAEWADRFCLTVADLERATDRLGVVCAPSPRERRALTMVSRFPGVSTRRIADRLGWPWPQAEAVLDRLARCGRITVRTVRGALTWWPAEAAEEVA